MDILIWTLLALVELRVIAGTLQRVSDTRRAVERRDWLEVGVDVTTFLASVLGPILTALILTKLL